MGVDDAQLAAEQRLELGNEALGKLGPRITELEAGACEAHREAESRSLSVVG